MVEQENTPTIESIVHDITEEAWVDLSPMLDHKNVRQSELVHIMLDIIKEMDRKKGRGSQLFQVAVQKLLQFGSGSIQKEIGSTIVQVIKIPEALELVEEVKKFMIGKSDAVKIFHEIGDLVYYSLQLPPFEARTMLVSMSNMIGEQIPFKYFISAGIVKYLPRANGKYDKYSLMKRCADAGVEISASQAHEKAKDIANEIISRYLDLNPEIKKVLDEFTPPSIDKMLGVIDFLKEGIGLADLEKLKESLQPNVAIVSLTALLDIDTYYEGVHEILAEKYDRTWEEDDQIALTLIRPEESLSTAGAIKKILKLDNVSEDEIRQARSEIIAQSFELVRDSEGSKAFVHSLLNLDPPCEVRIVTSMKMNQVKQIAENVPWIADLLNKGMILVEGENEIPIDKEDRSKFYQHILQNVSETSTVLYFGQSPNSHKAITSTDKVAYTIIKPHRYATLGTYPEEHQPILVTDFPRIESIWKVTVPIGVSS